jgi:ubiquinone biosynthesis protein UbiJ
LIRLSLLPASKARSLFNGHIQISGDIELGQHVKQLLDSIDIDWEGYLGQFTGEIVAHQIGRIVKKSTDFTTQLRVSIKEQLSEYVHEECRLFPPQEEVEDFYNDLDALSLRVERLEAHLNHYRAKP